MNNTPQGEAIEGNTADDSLMVDQGETLIHRQKDRKTSLCLSNQADRICFVGQNYHQRGERYHGTRRSSIQV
jgi:hypothetical protein